MKNKSIKIILIISVLVMTFLVLFSSCFELEVYADEGYAEKFKGAAQDSNGETKKVKEIIGAVLEITRNVGAFIAVAMILIVSTKYIIASAGERADIKKSAVAYVIGAIVMFSAAGIAEIMKNFILAAFE